MAGHPARVELDEDEVGLGGEAEGAAAAPVAGGDVEDVGAVGAGAGPVGAGGVVPEGGVGVARLEGAVDVGPRVDGPVAVAVAAAPAGALVPEREQARPPVRPAEAGVGDVAAPVGRGHDHAAAGHAEAAGTAVVARAQRGPRPGASRSAEEAGRLGVRGDQLWRFQAAHGLVAPHLEDAVAPEPARGDLPELRDDPEAGRYHPRTA